MRPTRRIFLALSRNIHIHVYIKLKQKFHKIIFVAVIFSTHKKSLLFLSSYTVRYSLCSARRMWAEVPYVTSKKSPQIERPCPPRSFLFACWLKRGHDGWSYSILEPWGDFGNGAMTEKQPEWELPGTDTSCLACLHLDFNVSN